MIRRVYANQHGIITLDSDMFGDRKRLSTGKKLDKRLLQWYDKHFDEEYKLLYDEKFQPKKKDFTNLTLHEYGKMVLSLTSDNRREYVQVKVMQVFERICNFKLSDNTLFGELHITDIKSMHVMMWQKECGLSSQTIATNRAYLNIVMQSAMNDDLIHKNPVQLVKLPKRKEVREKSYYTEDEIKTIIQTAQGQLKNYIQLCCFTGMRGSELLALRWSDDIDFEKGVIRVDTRIVLGKEDETKSRKVRFIPMFKQAREALVRQRQFSGLREFVFINKNGSQHFGTQFMGDSFSKMLKDNNLKHGTIHDLRRSFNTILKQYGYPTDWILDIMGHMDDRVNRNHYTGHLTVDMSKLETIAL